MTSPQYDRLAAAPAKLRGANGGTEAQRIATAGLAYALIHHELVELARALRREDFEATVFENITYVAFRFNGTSVQVGRFSNQAELRLSFRGFDGRVMAHENREQRHDVAGMSVDETRVAASETVAAIGDIIRREVALRTMSHM